MSGRHPRPQLPRRRDALKWLVSLAGLSVACAARPAAEAAQASTPAPTPIPVASLIPLTRADAHAPAPSPSALASAVPASATPPPMTPAPTTLRVGVTPAITQPVLANSAAFVKYAAEMRQLAIDTGDQAYGAIIVKGDHVVGLGPSRVVVNADATAHAEMEAIRDASRRLGSSDLSGCVMYSTSRPCAMCESAAYWARLGRLIHGSNAADAGAPRLGACG
ncbi:MAG: nucleoside deaminase [Thermoflexales bacterium]